MVRWVSGLCCLADIGGERALRTVVLFSWLAVC